MEDSVIWTEKYRPKDFSEIKGQQEIVNKIKAFVEKKNLPHLLFTGPAGVGKSTLALVVAKTLFGESWRGNFLELNSSDERGIDVIRNKVKDFARAKTLSNVPFKIIFLDECDALTKEAQQALRRTMENYTSTCRFILAANFSSKILEPIQSRCAIFRFNLLEKKDIIKIIDSTAKNESLKISSGAMEALYTVSEGDCRRVQNILQSCAALTRDVDEKLVYEHASFAEPKEIKEVLESAVSGKFIEARDNLLKVILEYGLSGLDVIKQFQKEIWALNINDKLKLNLIDKCGEIEFRITEGSDDFVQLESFLAYMGANSG